MPKEAKAKAPRGERKPKAKKDPNAPKKPLSAYMFFSKQAREDVKKENPDVTFGEVGKLLGQKWGTLSDEDKKPFEAQAAKDKERYEKEKGEYEAGGSASKAEAAADDDE